MTTFKDIFKKSFLQGFSRFDLTPLNMVIVLGLSALFAIYIFAVYRILTRKTFYSKSFNISLAAVTIITTAIIMTIQSNVVISLGMVGALSIVRFRTAVKEPMDLAFMFWAISTGIICGAGLAEISCILAIMMTLAVVVLDRIPIGRAPQILMVTLNDYNSEGTLITEVKKTCRYFSVKSRSLANGQADYVIEVRVREENEGELIKDVSSLTGVISSSLLRHDGEVTY